jgi:hypothetical protein
VNRSTRTNWWAVAAVAILVATCVALAVFGAPFAPWLIPACTAVIMCAVFSLAT